MTDFFRRFGLEGNEVDKAIATLIIVVVAVILRRLIVRQAH